jgi:hypothetical protein
MFNGCGNNPMVLGKHWTRRAAFSVTNGKSGARCLPAPRVCFLQTQVLTENNPWDKMVDNLARVTNGNKD